jgi:hypothetical protein
MRLRKITDRSAARPRAGSKVWTPEAGKVIEHSSGNRYAVADDGTTIRRVLGETEDVKREIERELKRLRAPSRKVTIARSGDDILVRVAKSVGYTEAYDLKARLMELPSGAGVKAVIAACKT